MAGYLGENFEACILRAQLTFFQCVGIKLSISAWAVQVAVMAHGTQSSCASDYHACIIRMQIIR